MADHPMLRNLNAVAIEKSDDMMRGAYRVFARDGTSLGSGVMGMGYLKESEGVADKIICGKNVYDVLCRMAQELTPHG